MKETSIDEAVAAISRIPVIPQILEMICRTTHMGFAVVARVTEDKWVACSVRDEIQFGLVPGGELKVDTTICHEIRQSGEAVIINHVEKDEVYYCHATPAMYGFQSYISVPIILQNGNFFGTLCAIDPRPNLLNTPEVISMFKLFSELISFHLGTMEKIETLEKQLAEERENAEHQQKLINKLIKDKSAV